MSADEKSHLMYPRGTCSFPCSFFTVLPLSRSIISILPSFFPFSFLYLSNPIPITTLSSLHLPFPQSFSLNLSSFFSGHLFIHLSVLTLAIDWTLRQSLFAIWLSFNPSRSVCLSIFVCVCVCICVCFHLFGI